MEQLTNLASRRHGVTMNPRRNFDDDGRPVPSVGFEYPHEPAPPSTAQREAVRLLALLLDGTRNAKVTAECLKHIMDPRGHTITELARRLKVSRMTLHRELRRLRADVTRPHS